MDSRLRRQAHLHSEDVVSKWNLLKALLQFHAFLASGVLFTRNYGIVCLVDVGIKYSFVVIRIDGAPICEESQSAATPSSIALPKCTGTYRVSIFHIRRGSAVAINAHDVRLDYTAPHVL